MICCETGAANTRRMSAESGGCSASSLQGVVSAQYRKLWDLRATLEQTEDLSECQAGSVTPATARQPDAAGETKTTHGGDRSPYERPTNTAPSFLPLPSSELRRRTYQHLAVERRLHQPAAAPGSSAPPGASVDSVEAPETDGDASDTSRYDFTTTSFESSTTTTTTTTDNNTDAGDGRVCPPSSLKSPRLSTQPAVQTRCDAARLRGGKEPREASDIDGVLQTAAETFINSFPPAPLPPQSSSVRRSYSNVSDVAESQIISDYE